MCCIYIQLGDAAVTSGLSLNLYTIKDKIRNDIVIIVGDFNFFSIFNSSRLYFEPVYVEYKFFDFIDLPSFLVDAIY